MENDARDAEGEILTAEGGSEQPPEEEVAQEPEAEAAGEAEEGQRPRGWKYQALLLLRDVGIAFLIVLVILGLVFAYTQVWPPMVVIESESMQHSSTESSVGVIDTGDLVLVQRADSRSALTTYIQGRATGHSTYGDYGDVIIYHKAGNTKTTPIIHRAFIYLEWNETAQGFDIPDLDNKYWMDRLGVEWGGTNRGAGSSANITTPYGLNGSLWIKDVGFTKENLTLSLTAYIGEGASGYVTAGDNNIRLRGFHSPWDTPLVRQEYIIGKARGELPWFGLLKLSLAGQIPWNAACDGRGGACAPANSWSSLTLSLALLVVVPIGTDLGLSLWARRREKRAAEAQSEEE
jgi:signal peptidase